MKKKTKKILSLLLAVVLMFGALPIVSTAGGTTNDNYFYFTTNNGEATLTGCIDTSYTGALAIPSSYRGFPVTSIAAKAFLTCNFSGITIPNTIKTIGEVAFKSCVNLKSINIPDSVTSIGEYCFCDCPSLTSAKLSNNITIIEEGTFLRSGLKSISIPKSVETIERSAFSTCENLVTVSIPDTVLRIGRCAFLDTGCENNPSNYKNNAFYMGNHLILSEFGKIAKDYKVLNGTKCIADYAFCVEPDVTSITLPDSVTSVGEYAFMGCQNLKSVTFGKGLIKMGDSLFKDCSALTKVTIPDNVSAINPAVFKETPLYNNSSNWKNGAFYIGNHLIVADTAVSGYYTVSPGTTTIADDAFRVKQGGDYQITGLSLPDSVISIGSHTFSGTQLKSVSFGKGLKYIGDYAFSYAYLLGNYITIPDSVISIGLCAFEHTFISSLYIGDGVKTIGLSAFKDCSKLKYVYVGKNVEKISFSTFNGCFNLEEIFIANPNCEIDNSSSTIHYNAKIIGFPNSTAQSYAKLFGREFESHSTHNYLSYVSKTATLSSKGKTTYVCLTCGYSTTKAIPKIKSVKLSKTKFTYNGKKRKPSVTVKDAAGNTLKQGTDYTVKYSKGRKNVGTYTVTVTFKGNYSGTKKLTFKILPNGTSISKLTAGKKQFTANWKKQSKQTNGYEIQYSTSSKMKNAKIVTVTKNSTTSKTVKNLKASKTYYVRIRTYKTVNGKKLYSSWSSTNKVKTK